VLRLGPGIAEAAAHAAGSLLGKTRTRDIVDASVVELSMRKVALWRQFRSGRLRPRRQCGRSALLEGELSQCFSVLALRLVRADLAASFELLCLPLSRCVQKIRPFPPVNIAAPQCRSERHRELTGGRSRYPQPRDGAPFLIAVHDPDFT